jgi:hypothetical protein
MKNSKWFLALVIGFLLGAATIGNLAATADAATANYSPHKVVVDSNTRSIEAYNINGYNYYKLRDIANVIDFRVWFNDDNNTVYIDTNHGYDPDYTGPAGSTSSSTPTPVPAPTTVKPAPTPQPAQSSDPTVYITRTGEKYHVGSCSYLRQSKISISLSEAKRQGYTPCSRCNPPK